MISSFLLNTCPASKNLSGIIISRVDFTLACHQFSACPTKKLSHRHNLCYEFPIECEIVIPSYLSYSYFAPIVQFCLRHSAAKECAICRRYLFGIREHDLQRLSKFASNPFTYLSFFSQASPLQRPSRLRFRADTFP